MRFVWSVTVLTHIYFVGVDVIGALHTRYETQSDTACVICRKSAIYKPIHAWSYDLCPTQLPQLNPILLLS